MPRVLVIDDQEEILSLITKALGTQDFTVTEAVDGASALELARQYPPDLVLCDVQMPGLDGYEVLARMRSNPATATTPFILMTGRADLPGMRQGMSLGADDYLPKPFATQDLLNIVSSRLQRHRSLRDAAAEKLAALRHNISMMLPHELLTPLTGILGASELMSLEAASLTPTQVAEFAQAIHHSGQRLYRLVQNFLIYAQIELLAAQPERVASLRAGHSTDVPAVVAGQARQKADAMSRATDLYCELCPAVAVISEEHLNKITTELVENAFKFSKPGTPVLLFSSLTGGSVSLTVRDSGRGMKAEHLAEIGAYAQFERKFYEQQGTGLGLAIVKRLVEIYGGHFHIESEVNRGTVVTLTLPLAH